MTLHLIALPHTRVTEEFVGCAYTAKALKFCRMMLGHEDVVLYAPEGSTRDTLETVDCLSDAHRVATFGADDPNRLPDWPTNEQAAVFNGRAAYELGQRWERGDLVLLTGGYTHEPIRAAVPDAIYCEPGVGYEGISTPFAAFESVAWRHYVYGRKGIDGRWFDTVIPNYFDETEFRLPEPGTKRDYLVYLGRLVPRKGVDVAVELATKAGLPLKLAGAGATTVSEGLVIANEGTPDELRLEGDVHYVGPVSVGERAELLVGAIALLAPTKYIEPFGGVAVEAMLSGTPAVTSDWGAFTETVDPGFTGYRFSTLREGVEAIERAAELAPALVREAARVRFSLDAVRPLFLDWFARLDTLHRDGWYEMAGADAIMRA